MDSLVKVRSFLGVAEAELARIRLAMDGIPARLSNAEMVTWFWYYSNVTGGVKLFVNAADVPRATLILSPKPVPQIFQPPQWICAKCQADVDGLWSFCWHCGTSRKGEEDPEFHTWYRDFIHVPRLGKSKADLIALYFSAVYLMLFIFFKASLVVISAWLITLILWGLLSRLLSLHKEVLLNAADLEQEQEYTLNVQYDPLRDEFNPADETAYMLWKATIFGFSYLPIFFPVALWLWFKIQRNALLLSEKGRRHYYYSTFFIILSIVLFVWLLFSLGLF